MEEVFKVQTAWTNRLVEQVLSYKWIYCFAMFYMIGQGSDSITTQTLCGLSCHINTIAHAIRPYMATVK